MNNKGFAITSTLYTIFILFIMLLLSILAGLSTRKKILEKSVETLEKSYSESEFENITITNNLAPVTGKYQVEFKAGNGNATITLSCYSYLKKGTDVSDWKTITYTTVDCNTVKNTDNFNASYKGVYKFSE